MKNKFKEHDLVVSNVDLANPVSNPIDKGTKGTIIHVYPNDYYEVEFFDSDNNTIDCVTVSGFSLKER